MAKAKKPITRRAFVGNAAVSAGLLGITAAANVGTNMFRSLLDHYLGGRPSTVEHVEGSENWDTAYYDAQYRGRTQATAAANEIVDEILGEGAVLLKNNGALPLAAGTEVSLLGRYAADPIYGGAGSGTVDPNACVNMHDGIAAAGLNINETAFGWINDNYSNYPKAEITMDDPSTATYYIGEIPFSAYSGEAQASISGTTALVVIGRGGGEGGDLSRDLLGDLNSGVSKNFTANDETANYVEGQHELELTVEEKSVIAAAKANCDKTIVIVNASTPMELGPLMSGEYEADAILCVGSLGATGSTAVGKLLTGEYNPSGRTTDIWPADFTADPTFGNFGGKHYTDVSGFYEKNYNNVASEGTAYFVEYKEGVYMGYRYYETAAAEAEAGNYAGFDYGSAVVFPFGYGLSYTTFTQTLDSVEASGDTVTVTATVTNAGSVEGKDVVEVYYSAPYTKGGIEKSSVVLAGFQKTKLLEPGESQALTISFAKEDMASYDYTGVKAEGGSYVLEAGDYAINLQTDSHNVVDSRTVHVDADVIYNDANDGKRASDDETAVNRFDDVSYGDDVTYLSRADWAGTMPTERPAAVKDATDEQIQALTSPAPLENADVEDIVTGKKNGLTLEDVRGLDYDDPKWNDLLDQVTLDEMERLVGNAGWATTSVPSVEKPVIVECDGPNGVNNLQTGVQGTQLTGQSTLGYTWNVELAQRLGQLFGQEAHAYGIGGLYAPGADTHRSAFGGRNYEYVGEDPVLTGKMVAAEVSGMQSEGVYAYVKHFIANDQETHRADGGLVTWANEQSLREIYLRAFEIVVKDGGATGMMSAYNRLGTTPVAESSAALTDVLRGEWGFRGAVVTDCTMAASTSDPNRSLRAGNDLSLNLLQDLYLTNDTTGTASGHQALRRATHNVLYMVANSSATEYAAVPSLRGTVLTFFIVLDVVVAALFGLYLWRRHVRMVRWREAGKPAGRIATWIRSRKEGKE